MIMPSLLHKPLAIAVSKFGFIALFIVVFLLKNTQAITQIKQSSISYTLAMPQPQTHYYEVAILVNNLSNNKEINQNYIDFKLPVWTPGSYLVREFAKSVEAFVAKTGDNITLKSEKVSKNTWRVYQKGLDKISVSYRVYAYEISVRTSFLDDSHGYLNGANVFMFVPQFMKQSTQLLIKPFTGWDEISTGLKKASQPNTFIAANYDILVDSPIEIGKHKTLRFMAANIPHSIAMYSNGDLQYDETKLLNDYKKITETATAVVGEQPCKDYTFIIHHLPNTGGGLEHLNSSTCQTSPNTYSNESTYKSFLSLLAHEYFHLWNVKRIRPIALGPFDYEKENYTHLLWVSEGITSFYQDYILRRANILSSTEYLNKIETGINNIENQVGQSVQSVAESSWDAWIKLYRPNENSRNSTISYYDKGGVLGGLLNLYILGETKGKANLDDVFKLLWNNYYKKLNRGFTDEEFQKACEQIVGKKMDDFFKKYVWGVELIDYNAFLKYVGLSIEDILANTNQPYLGAIINNGKIVYVQKGSGAYEDGLNVNDEIVTIDDVATNNIGDALASKVVGDTVKIKVKRLGQFFTYNIHLKRNPEHRFQLKKLDNCSAEQNALYKQWLYE